MTMIISLKFESNDLHINVKYLIIWIESVIFKWILWFRMNNEHDLE